MLIPLNYYRSQQHHGVVSGLETFKQKYVQEKIDQWIKELHLLCKKAWFKPRAANSGFTKGLKHKRIYFMNIASTIRWCHKSRINTSNHRSDKLFWHWQKIDIPPSKVWRPWNYNIFGVCTEGIRKKTSQWTK